MAQVAALWSLAHKRTAGSLPPRSPERWALGLRHSFLVQAVYELPQDRPRNWYATGHHGPSGQPGRRRLIGFARRELSSVGPEELSLSGGYPSKSVITSSLQLQVPGWAEFLCCAQAEEAERASLSCGQGHQ